MLWLLACWRPDTYQPPPPPEEAAAALQSLQTEAAEEDGAPLPEPDGAAPEGQPEDGAPDGAAEDTPDAPAIQPYRARILSAPATLVDDSGRPVAVLDRPLVEVEVRAEDSIRRKVWCGSCSPSTEGWIQAALVEKIP